MKHIPLLVAILALFICVSCDKKPTEPKAKDPVKVTKKLPSEKPVPAPSPNPGVTPKPTPQPGVTPKPTPQPGVAPKPAPQPGVTPKAGPYQVGQKVMAQNKFKQWYKASVIEVAAGKWKVHYEGFDANTDEWVTAEKIKQMPGTDAPDKIQGETPPEIVPAPEKKKCLQWKTTRRRYCKPRVRCFRTGSTCTKVANCRREPYRKVFTKQFCWNKPTPQYVIQRVCTPRLITSMTRRCQPRRVWITKTQQQCKTFVVKTWLTKRVCTPSQISCSMKKICGRKQVCVPRMVKKWVVNCRMIAGQRRCIKRQRMVRQMDCTAKVGKVSCSMQKICKRTKPTCQVKRMLVTRPQKRCRITPTRLQVTRQVCVNIPVKRRLTSCRKERRTVMKYVRHCQNRNHSVMSYRTVCNPGIKCNPGVEQCVQEKNCTYRKRRVCAAWE